MTVWLPYHRSQTPGLPGGYSYAYWDGSGLLPADPGDVRFLVAPPMPGVEHLLHSVLSRMRNLETLQLLRSGYDYMVPLPGEIPHGIRLATGRGVHQEATAQPAVTLLLALCRGLDQFAARQAQRRWLPEHRSTLVGKRVLVVGYGAVGAAVAAGLSAFRCQIDLVARTARATQASYVHGVAELAALLTTADAVAVCAPLTDETRGMLDAKALALLKDVAFLVNVARGELVDTRAVVRQVRASRLRVALDVTDPEPLPAARPRSGLPGALIPPTRGGVHRRVLPDVRGLPAAAAAPLRAWRGTAQRRPDNRNRSM